MAGQHRSGAENARPDKAGAPTGFVRRGGWWVVGQSVLMAGVVVGGVWGQGQWVSAAGFVAGWAVFSIGGAAGVAGVVHLGRARTAFPRPLAGSRLITSGIYGWIRHPLYSSVITASVGWGLIWASVLALVLAGVLAIYLDAKARREERWLREVFPDYGDYARRVSRLIPGVY